MRFLRSEYLATEKKRFKQEPTEITEEKTIAACMPVALRENSHNSRNSWFAVYKTALNRVFGLWHNFAADFRLGTADFRLWTKDQGARICANKFAPTIWTARTAVRINSHLPSGRRALGFGELIRGFDLKLET
jgi:hypothetical protein